MNKIDDDVPTSCSLCGSSSFLASTQDDEETLRTLISIINKGGDDCCSACSCHVHGNPVDHDDDTPTRLCLPCYSSLKEILKLRRQVEDIVSRLKKKVKDKRKLEFSSSSQKPTTLDTADADDDGHFSTLGVAKEEDEGDDDSNCFAEGWKLLEIVPSPLCPEEEEEEVKLDVDDPLHDDNLFKSDDNNKVPITTRTRKQGKVNRKTKKKKTAKKEPKVSCDQCGKLLHKSSLLRHKEQVHSSKVKICRKKGCGGLILADKEAYLSHLQTVHGESKDGTLSPCDACKKVFPSKCKLKEHLRRSHKGVLQKKKGTTTHKSFKKCPICNEGFVSDSLFQAHSHPDPNDPSLASNQCPDCHRAFSVKASLVNHLSQAHSGHKGPFVCEVCGAVFPNVIQFRYHKKWKHKSKEDHAICSKCGLKLTSYLERFNHERVVHNGQQSLQCYFCEKIFTVNSALKKHLYTHTLEKPFKCAKCGKEFGAPDALRRHSIATLCGDNEERRKAARRKHNELKKKFHARKSFVCHICGDRFGQKQQLATHLKRRHPDA